jgi:hypothetical protein
MTRTHGPTHGRGLHPPTLTVLLATVAALVALVAPGSAHALGFSSVSAQPASSEAGANSDFSISMSFSDASDDVKDLVISLPPGMVGNPTVPETCTVADLNADACPAASDVGDTTATANALDLPVPIDIEGDLYNLTPQSGEPARFGIVLRPLGGLLPKVFLQSGAQLRPEDFGLDTVINDIPRTATGIPITLTSMTVSLSGRAGDPEGGFIRNPTSCGSHAARFSATSYADPDTPVTAQAAPFTTTACEQLPFTPEFSAEVGAPGKTDLIARPPVRTTIEQTIEEAGMKRARVLLPPLLNAAGDALEQTCPAPQFATGACPAESIVGAAVAGSPLLGAPLTGPVVLIAPSGPGLPSVGLDLSGPMALQLTGQFVLGSGKAGLEFAGLPDIPISEFTLAFEPDHLVLNAESLCNGKPRIFSTEFEGHNGALRTGDVTAAIDGCASPGPPPAKGNAKGKCKKKQKGKGKKKGKKRPKACKKKKKKKKR